MLLKICIDICSQKRKNYKANIKNVKTYAYQEDDDPLPENDAKYINKILSAFDYQ